MAFDTHASVKKLQEAGFTAQQAEAQVELLVEIIEGNLATKLDIESVHHKIELVRHEIELVRRDMKEMETRFEGKFRLLYWMLAFNLTLTLAGLSITAAILLKLPGG